MNWNELEQWEVRQWRQNSRQLLLQQLCCEWEQRNWVVTGKECKVKCVCVCVCALKWLLILRCVYIPIEVIQERYKFIMQENKGKIAEWKYLSRDWEWVGGTRGGKRLALDKNKNTFFFHFKGMQVVHKDNIEAIGLIELVFRNEVIFVWPHPILI